MKKIFALTAIAVLGLASCNKTDLTPQVGETWVQIDVQMPEGASTKSSTSDLGTTAEGTEAGQATENTVSSLKVILVDAADPSTIINCTASKGGQLIGTTYSTNPFPVTGINASHTYNVYVVVNDSEDVASLDASKSVSSADLTTTYAQADHFMMTSAHGPASKAVGSDLSVYTKTAPLNLGTIEVERAVARFDYRSGVTDDEHTVDGHTIKIVGASIMNMSKSFYTFKRVSADGTNTAWSLGGIEQAVNYVVDHNYDVKSSSTAATTAPALYLNHMTTPAAAPYGGTYTDISTILGGTATQDVATTTGYHLWTYCTENTIKADPAVNQVNGISTAIVFKAKLTGTKFDGTNNVYVLNNKVIGSWSDVMASADADVVNARAAYSLDAVEANNTVARLSDAGFLRYRPNGGEYYAYYIYWNRHNNNNDDAAMGPMEFAVVRNNVYKLAVTAITRFGHSNDPINPPSSFPQDPDPDYPNPINPDEDSNVYMTVSVQIRPWTVRQNNITF